MSFDELVHATNTPYPRSTRHFSISSSHCALNYRVHESLGTPLDGGIALIGLDRGAKRNALSSELSAQLRAASTRAYDEARVAVIFSHGDHFCAGLDLKEASTWMTDPDAKVRPRMIKRARPFEEIARAPIPFVAAINGACNVRWIS